jgi:hypothetical protein
MIGFMREEVIEVGRDDETGTGIEADTRGAGKEEEEAGTETEHEKWVENRMEAGTETEHKMQVENRMEARTETENEMWVENRMLLEEDDIIDEIETVDIKEELQLSHLCIHNIWDHSHRQEKLIGVMNHQARKIPDCLTQAIMTSPRALLLLLLQLHHRMRCLQMRYGASTEERCAQNMCGKCFQMPYSKLFFIFGMNGFDLVQML